MTVRFLPLEKSSQLAQEAIIQEFSLLDDWSDRYQYIIDLGKKLPPFPNSYHQDSYRLHGCQSQVWIVAQHAADQLYFLSSSDSAIVCGLIFLMLRVYSGRNPTEIVQTQPDFLQTIGLLKHLSPSRHTGLRALLDYMQTTAQQYVCS